MSRSRRLHRRDRAGLQDGVGIDDQQAISGRGLRAEIDARGKARGSRLRRSPSACPRARRAHRRCQITSCGLPLSTSTISATSGSASQRAQAVEQHLAGAIAHDDRRNAGGFLLSPRLPIVAAPLRAPSRRAAARASAASTLSTVPSDWERARQKALANPSAGFSRSGRPCRLLHFLQHRVQVVGEPAQLLLRLRLDFHGAERAHDIRRGRIAAQRNEPHQRPRLRPTFCAMRSSTSSPCEPSSSRIARPAHVRSQQDRQGQAGGAGRAPAPPPGCCGEASPPRPLQVGRQRLLRQERRGVVERHHLLRLRCRSGAAPACAPPPPCAPTTAITGIFCSECSRTL